MSQDGPNQWQTQEFADRLRAHRDRRGLQNKDVVARSSREPGKTLNESDVSRALKASDEATLGGAIRLAALFDMAPPKGLLSANQERLLSALERLVAKTEEQYGPGARSVQARIDALLALIDDEVDARSRWDQDPLGESA